MVDPASTCSAIAGRSTVTVTGLPSAGRFVSRIGRDGAAGQRAGAALGHLGQRPVQHRPVVGNRCAAGVLDGRRNRDLGHRDGDPRGAGDHGQLVERGGGEPGGLARAGRRRTWTARSRPGRTGPAGVEIAAGDAPGGFTTNCGSPVSGMRTRLVLRPGRQAGVGRDLEGAAAGRSGVADRAVDGVPERVGRDRPGAGQVVLEPLGDPGLGGGVRAAAVVAAVVPGHGDGGAVRGDRPGVGVGLVEPEQGVPFALHQQRRCGDVADDRLRAGPIEQGRDRCRVIRPVWAACA